MLSRTHLITAIALLCLTAASARADDDTGPRAEDPAAPAAANKNLADTANTRAAEDAIEAIRAANRRHLDIRILGRTLVRTENKTVVGR